MSRGKKINKKQKNNQHSLADVTINDFANNSVCMNRAKKSIANVNNVMKDLQLLQTEDTKSWDEKEFEGDFVGTENEDGSVSYSIKKSETKKRKKTITEYKEGTGVEYPYDIWCLIGSYIRPEDVGRFSGICKTTYAVVSQKKFWVDLYEKHYKNITNLPVHLTRNHLVRKFGIRSNVIKALYYMYQPFIDRLQKVRTMDIHPDCLIKRQCTVMWHRKCSNRWTYFFKLKEQMGSPSYRQSFENADILETLEDVFANADDNCKILIVLSQYYYIIPPVVGCILALASLSLSSNLQKHRLQLKFATSAYCAQRTVDSSSCFDVVFNEVINFKVLDWWHPEAPYSNTFDMLLNRD